jgi:peptidyl-tRNA hydrolase
MAKSIIGYTFAVEDSIEIEGGWCRFFDGGSAKGFMGMSMIIAKIHGEWCTVTTVETVTY